MSAGALAGRVSALYRFPVKGLSPEPLDTVALVPGEGFPYDRVAGFLRHGQTFDPDAPKPMPKTCFHMLAREGALARLATRYDPERDALTIGAETYDLGTDTGRTGAEAAIAATLGLPPAEAPRLVRGEHGHRFTDVSVTSAQFMNAVSLISLASVADLGARIGADLDPMRFRGNILFEGWPAWEELSLVERTITVGTARLRILARIKRCAATTVNPATGENDIFVPRHLQEIFGHADLGIYAEVVEGGPIAPGDPITLV